MSMYGLSLRCAFPICASTRAVIAAVSSSITSWGMAAVIARPLVARPIACAVRSRRSSRPVGPSASATSGTSRKQNGGRAAATDGLDYWPLMAEFLAHTGLRISEAVALRWRDLDLTARRVHVIGRIYKGKWSEPKSPYAKHPKRRISLSPGMTTKLRRHQKQTGGSPNAPVFPSKDGTHLDPANLYKRVFKPAFRRAGVGWAGFHTFRHTCASLLFRDGANLNEGAALGGHANVVQVQRWLGHHSPGFTLATYIHLLSGDDVPDAAFFDSITHGSRKGSRTDPNKPAKRAARPRAKIAAMQDVQEEAA